MGTEDFLYHLYRASAFLEDGAAREAMVEVTSALAHEPNDLRAKELQERARHRTRNPSNGASRSLRAAPLATTAATAGSASAALAPMPSASILGPLGSMAPAPSPSFAPSASASFVELPLADGTELGVRVDAIRAFTAQLGSLVERDARAPGAEHAGSGSSPLLGGATHPFVEATGPGRVVLSPRSAHRIESLVVPVDQPLFLREDALVAFDRSLLHTSARVGDLDVVQLQCSGAEPGRVLVEALAPLRRLRVDADQPMTVRADRVLVGWTGRLLAHAVGADEAPVGLRALLRFSATGVLGDPGARPGAHLLLALG